MASALQSQPKNRHGIVGFESDDAAAAWGVKLARDAKTFAARRPRRAWYEANRSKLPATRIHRTRSGGLHVLFKHLAGLRNSAGRVAAGVDVRADGGYIVWWASTGFEHRAVDVQEWPLWLLPAVMTPPKPPPAPYPKSAGQITDRALEGIVRTVATAPEGQRNAITYWAAHRLRECVAQGKMTEGLAHEFLIEAAARAGLPHREASLTINSAMRSGGHG